MTSMDHRRAKMQHLYEHASHFLEEDLKHMRCALACHIFSMSRSFNFLLKIDFFSFFFFLLLR